MASQVDTSDAPPLWRNVWLGLVRAPIAGLDAIGAVILFSATALWRAAKPPFRYGNFASAMEFVGVGSLGIVLLTGAFTGAVFAIQTAVAFQIFNAKSLIGGSVALALVRELAPTIGALMVAGRVGSAMTTELGTMRVTEQIDALETMAVDPVHYLVSPRIVACTLTMPALAVGFNAVGLAGAYLVSVGMLGIDHASFFSRIYVWIVPSDIACTLIKATAFGLVIGSIASFKGFFATGGSRGVGLATTSTVVTTSIVVLIVDYVITSIWLVAFPSTGTM
jgi:phospholipid/cholesterol/gamma-HCH transport system permease protein